jgi:hypothetical protein
MSGGITFFYPEIGEYLRLNFFQVMRADNGIVRLTAKQRGIKTICCFFGCIDLNMYTVIAIAYPAMQSHSFGQPANKWPETDALNQPANMDMIGVHKKTIKSDYTLSGTSTFSFSHWYQAGSPSPLVQLTSINCRFGLT